MTNSKYPIFISSLRLLFLVFSLCVFSCGDPDTDLPLEENNSELSLKKVVLALKANKQPASMLVEKQDLEAYLSAELQRPVEVMIPSDSSVVVESFRNGTLDLGYLSSTDAARNLSQETADILLVHLKNGQPHYQVCLAVRRLFLFLLWESQKEYPSMHVATGNH